MTRRKAKPGVKDASGTPSAGERVVFDANVVIDFLLAELMPKPTLRAEATRRVLAICCVACFSEKLWGEVIQNCHKRGVPMPRARVLGFRAELERREKLILIKKSRIDAVHLPEDVVEHAPREDHHIVQLALAANARWIFTADEPLRDSAARFRTTPPLRVESPEWVLDEIAEPESPCSGDGGSE